VNGIFVSIPHYTLDTMHTALALSLLAAFELVSADKNVTIDDSDTSLITYNDKVLGEASICAFTEDGNLMASQPGCYNVQPSNCTTGATVGRGTGAGVTSFKFHGALTSSASLLKSLLFLYQALPSTSTRFSLTGPPCTI